MTRTTIHPDVQHRLREEWLPALRQVRDRRRPIRLLLVAIVLVPLFSAVALIVHMFFRGEIRLVEAGITITLMAVVAAAVVYLGKIQACDDGLVRIEFAVQLGYVEHLIEATSELGCYGKFQGVLLQGVLKDAGTTGK